MKLALIGVGQAGGKVVDEFLAYDALTDVRPLEDARAEVPNLEELRERVERLEEATDVEGR
ncbi:hypothetical protein [Halorubrum yunnanense]|uniref:Cell division protein n=1 Tax=Halorubrum yunnanense TaxID=1526162 RepID=A0ABD5YFH3_9EURY|nr:hypothetical protein [Halorubrum yunnanense]